MGILDFLIGKRPSEPDSPLSQPAKPDPKVHFDDSRIVFFDGEATHDVTWDELLFVKILFTDKGKYLNELIWELSWAPSDDFKTMRIDHDTEGMLELSHQLLKLPNFDRSASLAAFECKSGHQRFYCWERPLEAD